MLTGYLSLTAMVTAVLYTLLDVYHGIYYPLVAYSLLFFSPIISLFLIRRKQYKSAKILLMAASNIVVCFIAVNDPFETGVFLLFIPAAVSSFAILEYRDRITGVLMSVFTFSLFLIAYFGNFQTPTTAPLPEQYIQTSFVFNYIIAAVISVLIIYFLITLNQFTEQELIEKEKIAQQKNNELRKVNEELDRFVYSVSHDLRSPLSSILGLINLARRSSEPEELNQYLEMIRDRVLSQDHFIREIIDFSRNARTAVMYEDIVLYDLVETVFDTLRYNPGADRITFRNLAPRHLKISSDRRRLTIILSNLIGNAIKYHDLKKPDPTVEVGYTREMNTLYVEDNGTGIPPEHINQVFDMFFRASEQSSGSGLGLFITREAVEKLRGGISVSSVHGKGSTFYVTLNQTAVPSQN